MTRDELRYHALAEMGYSERMTQDLLDAYDLGARAKGEECAKAAASHSSELWKHDASAVHVCDMTSSAIAAELRLLSSP